jgi:two-component system, sensor histidine kinase and response regulator
MGMLPVAPGEIPYLDGERYALAARQYGAVVTELVRLFVETTPPILDELRVAPDAAAVRRAAHKLRGSCRCLGAEHLHGLAAAVEDAGRVTGETLAGLDAAFARTCEALFARMG